MKQKLTRKHLSEKYYSEESWVCIAHEAPQKKRFTAALTQTWIIFIGLHHCNFRIWPSITRTISRSIFLHVFVCNFSTLGFSRLIFIPRIFQNILWEKSPHMFVFKGIVECCKTCYESFSAIFAIANDSSLLESRTLTRQIENIIVWNPFENLYCPSQTSEKVQTDLKIRGVRQPKQGIICIGKTTHSNNISPSSVNFLAIIQAFF